MPASGSRTARPGSPGRTTSPTGRASSAPIPWVYAEIARVLADHEQVEILCHRRGRRRPRARGARRARRPARSRPAARRADRSRLAARLGADRRRSTTTGDVVLVELGVQRLGEVRQLAAGRAGRRRDRAHHRAAARRADARPTPASASCSKAAASRSTATGLMLVTEEWLLSDVQVRNPGLTRADYERIFAEWLGVRGRSGSAKGASATTRTARRRRRAVRRGRHDRARGRRGSGRREPRALDGQPAAARARRARRQSARCASSRCPFRGRVIMNGERLPASYANFYIANGVVLVPTFNDPNDRVALNTLASADADAPGRRHPRRRSGVGPRDAALPDAAGAEAAWMREFRTSHPYVAR